MEPCFQQIASPFFLRSTTSRRTLTVTPRHPYRPSFSLNSTIPRRISPRMSTDAKADASYNAFQPEVHPTRNDVPESDEPCTYCNDVGSVQCPVCEGRGYHGRTITCYYCRGATEIECPLCVDDVYKFSYVASQEDSENVNQQDAVGDATIT